MERMISSKRQSASGVRGRLAGHRRVVGGNAAGRTAGGGRGACTAPTGQLRLQDRAYSIPVTNFAIRPPAVSGDTVVVYQEPIPSPSPQTFQLNVFVRQWRDSCAFQQTLTPSDATVGFISSFDISGDPIVVGSADTRPTAPTRARRTSSSAAAPPGPEQSKIYASDAGVNGYFGQDVAIDGDTAMVGAAGGVYVFERNLGGANNWGPYRSPVSTAFRG